jgi:hypothetical protein
MVYLLYCNYCTLLTVLYLLYCTHCICLYAQNEVDNKVFLDKANFFNKIFFYCFCFVDREARDGEVVSNQDEGCRGGVD